MTALWTKRTIHNDEDDWDIEDYQTDDDDVRELDDEETTIVIDEEDPKIGKWRG